MKQVKLALSRLNTAFFILFIIFFAFEKALFRNGHYNDIALALNDFANACLWLASGLFLLRMSIRTLLKTILRLLRDAKQCAIEGAFEIPAVCPSVVPMETPTEPVKAATVRKPRRSSERKPKKETSKETHTADLNEETAEVEHYF